MIFIINVMYFHLTLYKVTLPHHVLAPSLSKISLILFPSCFANSMTTFRFRALNQCARTLVQAYLRGYELFTNLSHVTFKYYFRTHIREYESQCNTKSNMPQIGAWDVTKLSKMASTDPEYKLKEGPICELSCGALKG